MIEPLDPLPTRSVEGPELVVGEPQFDRSHAEIEEWARERDATNSQIPAAEHESFLEVIEEIERESKEAVRKQWGLTCGEYNLA